MAEVTFSVRLPEATRELLDALSKSTQRSRNFLAREAIARYVQDESEIIEGIEQGIADIRSGRVVPHDTVVKQSRAIIAAARKRSKK